MSICYYFSGDFSSIEDLYLSLNHVKKKFKKNENITGMEIPADNIYYILKGEVASSYYHNSGKIKSFAFFSKGCQFPYYFPGEDHYFRSISFHAITDVETLVFNRKQFGIYVNTIPELNQVQYKAYIELCIFFAEENANQMFNSGMEKICIFLYTYVKNAKPANDIIKLGQNEIMEFVGLNRTNLTKYLNILKKQNIIETSHKSIKVLDLDKLLSYIS